MEPSDPIPSRHSLGFRLAKIGMQKSPYKIKIGAALVHKSKYIVSWNQKKTCPSVKREHGYKYDNMSHAEFNLFSHTQEIIGNVRGTVYVYRELADGSPAMSRPCPSCISYLKKIGIKKIVYTTYGSFKEERI